MHIHICTYIYTYIGVNVLLVAIGARTVECNIPAGCNRNAAAVGERDVKVCSLQFTLQRFLSPAFEELHEVRSSPIL